ncbi:MAG: hypothetical protein GXP31_01515 [Kiritimatiellaeota bacterium]|nr:hypothetical protein [Kiritimatiellota bacterium]
MPEKYHIHTEPAPPRFQPVGKLGIVDWREDCSNCHNCVKRQCVYGFFRDEADRLREDVDFLDYLYQCKGCLSCVQNCTKAILTRVINPEYERLGDSHYTPDVILATWFQAETGRIPVSGSGYGGPFSGPGFDSMWTDMSEIVRPTRDGIHGREYINTSVDLGRKLDCLAFEDGRLSVLPPPLISIPLPILFDLVPRQWDRAGVPEFFAAAAARIGTLAVMPQAHFDAQSAATQIVPLLESSATPAPGARMVMLPDGDDVVAAFHDRKATTPGQLTAIRVRATPAACERVRALTAAGAEVIHLVFDRHGLESGAGQAPRHMRDVLREVHGALVRDGARGRVTLIASGGVALAEHVVKAMICGADAVAVDIPLILALECRLCNDCLGGYDCPVALDTAEPAYAVQRIVNLMGAWHQQLIEMLGAMGLREVRRLRGETGRCMFFEDLERDTFGRLFGRRRD